MAEAAPNVVNLLADSPKVIRDSLHVIGPISAANIITLRAEGKLCLKALENACAGVSKNQWKQWFNSGSVVPDLRETQESILIDWDKAPIVKKTTSTTVDGGARAKPLPILTGGSLKDVPIITEKALLLPRPDFVLPPVQLDAAKPGEFSSPASRSTPSGPPSISYELKGARPKTKPKKSPRKIQRELEQDVDILKATVSRQNTQLRIAVAELEATKHGLDEQVKESAKEAETNAKFQEGLNLIKDDYTQRLQSFMDKVEESISRLQKENNPYLVYRDAYPPDSIYPNGGTIVINDNAQEENNDAGTENVNVATGRVAHPRTSTPRFQPMRSSRKSRYSKKSNLRNKSSKSKFRSSKQKYTESSGSDTSSEITCEERITYSSSSSSDEALKIRQSRRRHWSPPSTKMATYDGSGQWDPFIYQFERIASRNKWTQAKKFDRMIDCLRGRALEHASLMKIKDNDFKKLSRRMRRHFQVEDTPETARMNLRALEQTEEETITEFADRVQKMVMVGFEDSNEHVWNRLAVDTFLSGCIDVEAKKIVLTQNPPNLDKALKAMKQVIASHRIADRKTTNSRPKKPKSADYSVKQTGCQESAPESDYSVQRANVHFQGSPKSNRPSSMKPAEKSASRSVSLDELRQILKEEREKWVQQLNSQ